MSRNSRKRSWAPYRPDRELRDEDGRLIADPDEPTADAGADGRDDAVEESGGDDASGSPRPTGVPYGCLFMIGLILAVTLVVWVVNAVRSGGDDYSVSTGGDPANPIDPDQIAPIDPAVVRDDLDRAARVPEVAGLPVSHMNIGPTNAMIDFYDRTSDQSLDYARYDGQPGYSLRVKENPFEFIDDLLFELEDIDPRVLADVSKRALAAADDPRSYSLVIDRDLSTDVLQISAVVSEVDDTESFIYRTDAEGEPIEEVQLGS